ncbi:CCA tRNA nucleotidyltransferase [Nodularia spumigena CS-591/04]|uniref:CCA tRNA nucleotidyltransferase n=1 Tax=Nodularia spumigena TaxID=70799 RepID=UPI002330823D|nr:CCA tRNA nucleotidyltransferase [Nodularia spumigena]MDB9321760.1 CCA tRNA nucleotidyltransferase [Nodularia spumigena CS-591/07A]MDB9329564.1 CCA tRNA nucleotidyltransferase [Nodularia spumigena CS-591/04]MDB9346520.1 CCA tRNA nucleotidyltransferase [Nodularia spumigena CS-588/01]MDB9353286.1 CCA tRNA nucleotidyltransferase [Nodularia spumigena CS-588/05]MDB9360736.1 CCA tRNA nucleotidyltransferase [Nodularia spumigena CS-588/02]
MTIHGLIYPTLVPDNWPFGLEWLPQPAYIVGGAVRDALLGRTREYLDLDFIIPSGAVGVAQAIARHYQAGFVLLDPQRKIARVVFPEATVDFAQQEGDSLETDLHRRDFTINAIAYNPHTAEIIDPLQGCADLEQGILRMVSAANLKDDPLRLMRAYRQAAQLDFTIEPDTDKTIQSLASQIIEVAAERVRVEINYLLANSQGTFWLKKAAENVLLAPFFPNATPQSWEKLAKVDTVAALITQNYPQLSTELQQYVRDTVKTTWLGIAKLACLVHPSSEVAEIELQALTYSRGEIKAVTTALKLVQQLKSANMSVREQYFFFQEAGNVFAATIVLALVDDNLVSAMSGDKSLRVYAPLISRYLNPDDLVAHPTKLVSGNELIIALNISPSPKLGELLTEIAVAQAEGKISTPEQAIALARSLLLD